MNEPKKFRKLIIVFEETGTHDGKGFNVYLDGDRDRLKTITDPHDLSPAEFWASKLFSICIGLLKEAGVVQSKRPLNGEN